jgi:hypothetical protein
MSSELTLDPSDGRGSAPKRAPFRPATLAAKLALAPLLIAQGRCVRATALKLPEAAGERRGVAGTGRVALRVLIVGDSSAAGVGVGTQDEAFAGQLAQALAERTGAAVGWQLVATSGHTAQDAARALAGATLATADLLVTALGVNDVVGQTRPARFLAALDEIHALAPSRWAGGPAAPAAAPGAARSRPGRRDARGLDGARRLPPGADRLQAVGPAGGRGDRVTAQRGICRGLPSRSIAT